MEQEPNFVGTMIKLLFGIYSDSDWFGKFSIGQFEHTRGSLSDNSTFTGYSG